MAGDYTSSAGHTLCSCRHFTQMHPYRAKLRRRTATTPRIGRSDVRIPVVDEVPTQPPTQRVPGPFPGVKRPGCQVNRSPPSSAEVKIQWIYTSAPPV